MRTHEAAPLHLHRALMAHPGKLDAARLRELAIAAGLDWPRLEADLRDHGAEIDGRLRRHGAQAWSLGLRGTPAYLVGPLLIEGGLDDRALSRAVASARRSGPPRPVVGLVD